MIISGLYVIQIDTAKLICECLVASEGFELKFEHALCSFLLGQVYICVAFLFCNLEVLDHILILSGY